ncbi:MAG: T9SS type A sorting domain-containing protein [Bacteroidetes bacterium]|nr:T9SS type A sorting domain-containing protein [Bacteroidota bacterium]
MKKLFLFILLSASLQASAHFRYTLTTSTQAYVPLSSNSTAVNGSTLWAFDSYVIPLPFSFKLNGVTQSNYNIALGAALSPASDTDQTKLLSGFSVMDAWLADRGLPLGPSKSPIRYRIDGTAPNRIFKLEYFNAGFMPEGQNYGTMLDSVNVQVWVFESTDVVELHYGDSKITHAKDYFFNHSNPFISYIYNIDVNTGNATYYYLHGNAASPVIDTVSSNDLDTNIITLSFMPPSGTVYRFIPKTSTALIDNSLGEVKVYPTYVVNCFTIASVPEGTYHYQLYSLNGSNTNISGALHTGYNTIACDGLATGIYLLNITNEKTGAVISRKIIK